MLLQEYIPFQIDKTLLERSIKEDKTFEVKGVLQRAEAKNQNGRIYPKEILEREIENYINGPIAESRALGELDHPESSVINLQNVSHNITKVYWDGDDVMGEVEILSTPAGNILKELFRNGITVGISSRGMGSVKDNVNEGTVEVQDDFELLCWDFVSTPSTPGAYVHPIKEGLNIDENSFLQYKEVNKIITEILCNSGQCPII